MRATVGVLVFPVVLLTACGDDTSGNDVADVVDAGRDGEGGADADAPADESGAGDAPLDDLGADGADGGADADADAGSLCPRLRLEGALPIHYSDTTVGRPDLVRSARLEWRDAPDDALLFVVPSAGSYRIYLTGDTSTLGGCGASIQEYETWRIFDSSFCPAAGAVADIDGVYCSFDYPLDLTAGQEVLIWISCAYWNDSLTVDYTINIEAV
jgi:hypothetical protein